MSVEYKERISLLKQQIIFINQEIIKTVKFQQVSEECYKIFKKEKSSLFFNFMKQIEWMQEILNLTIY